MTRAEALEHDAEVAQLLVSAALTAAQVADRMGLTERTARRCIGRLSRYGLTVVTSTEKRHERLAGRPLNRYRIQMPRGRVCGHEGCGTLLRSGNPAAFCERHGGGYVELVGVRA